MSVYFIRNKTTGNIKVGCTRGEPMDRLKALQTGCDGDLELMLSVPGWGSREESTIHARFRGSNVRGEYSAHGRVLEVDQAPPAQGGGK